MSTTLQDRIDVSHRKALGVSRQALVKVGRVRLNGATVLEKYNALNPIQQRKLGFNRQQIEVIKSGCDLEDMDITLVCDVIVAFGGDLSPSLSNSIRQLRHKRNEKAHEVRPSLTKTGLKTELSDLHSICRSMLGELKVGCSPEACSLLDGEVVNIGLQLTELGQTLEDDLQQKTEDLISASADMITMLETMKEEAISIMQKDDQVGSSGNIPYSVTKNINQGPGTQITAGNTVTITAGAAVNFN